MRNRRDPLVVEQQRIGRIDVRRTVGSDWGGLGFFISQTDFRSSYSPVVAARPACRLLRVVVSHFDISATPDGGFVRKLNLMLST